MALNFAGLHALILAAIMSLALGSTGNAAQRCADFNNDRASSVVPCKRGRSLIQVGADIPATSARTASLLSEEPLDPVRPSTRLRGHKKVGDGDGDGDWSGEDDGADGGGDGDGDDDEEEDEGGYGDGDGDGGDGGGDGDGGDGDEWLFMQKKAPSFTQVSQSSPNDASKQGAHGYASDDYQPETWQDDLDRLRAEARSLKRDLDKVPPDQQDLAHKLMDRLGSVNQELTRLSAPLGSSQEATADTQPPAQDSWQPQEEVGQPGSAPATAAAGEADPSAYLSMPSDSPQPQKDPSEFLTLPIDNSPQDTPALLAHLPSSDTADAIEASGRQDSVGPAPAQTTEAVSWKGGRDYALAAVQSARKPKSADQADQGHRADRDEQLGSLLGHSTHQKASVGMEVQSAQAVEGDPLWRPSAAVQKPDFIEFGLDAETLYGMDLKHDIFTLDLTIKLQWPDARAVALIPKGQTSVTLTDEEAKGKLWLPDIEITNRDFGEQSHKLVSTTVATDGLVSRVERSLAMIRHKYVLTHYPFDEQELNVELASAKYMENEVKLMPTLNMSGVNDALFDGESYKMLNFHVSEYQDIDGSLTKSRGYLQIVTARKMDKFVQSFLVPTTLCMVCSLAVFWLPHTPMFITPRLTLAVLMLLIFRNFAVEGQEELPPGAPYNWFDLLCMNVQLNMGLIICWNIFIETASQGLNCNTTGKAVNGEMRAVAPMLAVVTFGVIFAGAGPNSALNLPSVALIVLFILVLSNTIYIGCVSSTLAAERAHNKFLGKRQVAFTETGGKPEMC